MIQIGITGGIGSGKSIVCEILKVMHIPVFYSDDVAKKILLEDKSLHEEINQRFKVKIFHEGKFNKELLASIVFNDEADLKKLNELIHPLVKQEYEKWLRNNDGQEVVAKEAAILFETGIYLELDYNILVVAPEALRIARVTKRDKVSEEQVRSRMKHQWEEKDKKKLADFIVNNDGEQLLISQVLQMLNLIKM